MYVDAVAQIEWMLNKKPRVQVYEKAISRTLSTTIEDVLDDFEILEVSEGKAEAGTLSEQEITIWLLKTKED